MTDKQLSAFHRTVLEIAAQAETPEAAILYVQDWLNDKDTRCTRTDAARYITNAQAAEREANKAVA